MRSPPPNLAPRYTRREFLRSSLPLAAAAASVPSFLTHTVWGAPNTEATSSIPGMPDERILLVVQLAGGNDGLNTVVPFQDPDYYRHRPGLGLDAKTLLRVDGTLGLHPALAEAQSLFGQGEMAWIQHVGYPNPNRSHFRSMEIWETASGADQQVSHGWLGRFLDAQCKGDDPIPATAAVTVGREMPQSLWTPRGGGAGVVVEDPDAYAWQASGRSSTQDARQKALFRTSPDGMGPQDPAMMYLRRTAMDAALSADLIAEAARKYRSAVDYPPHAFGRDLRRIASFIGGGLKSRVYYARLGGFDTHADQPGAHARLLSQLAEGLDAFRKDMVRQRHWERILVMGFSEFGRRVAENGSLGTDHGAAGLMFLAGAKVRGGLHGEPPDLKNLVNGDLAHKVDFRSVYGTLLDQWLGLSHAPILGGNYPTLPLLKG